MVYYKSNTAAYLALPIDEWHTVAGERSLHLRRQRPTALGQISSVYIQILAIQMITFKNHSL